MKQYITDFTKHLTEAIKIGNSANLTPNTSAIDNVCIAGLGGSGIGGTIVAQVVANEIKIPIVVSKDYSIPAFVGKNTLFIACSYSGNTEETLETVALADKTGASIMCITSGGKLLEIAKNNNYNCITIPANFPPRAAFGYSFPQLLYALKHYKLISFDFEKELNTSIKLIDNEEGNIQREAKLIADKLHNTIPIIYTAAPFEGVAVRFRQQINENSKMLCWHHAVPEMNHNELVGWAGGKEELSVIIFRNESDYYRTQKRIEVNKTVFSKYTSNINEINSKGNTDIIRSLYLIHLGDWISEYLANAKGIDPVEVDVITYLKGELSKI
jgi:glucose/mannose-6-phosphate isomerase